MVQAHSGKRAPLRHHWTSTKRGAQPLALYETPTDTALLLIWPWALGAYPGALEGAAQTFRGKAAASTIRDWRRGRRRTPQWARQILIERLEKLASDAQNAVAALKNEEART